MSQLQEYKAWKSSVLATSVAATASSKQGARCATAQNARCLGAVPSTAKRQQLLAGNQQPYTSYPTGSSDEGLPESEHAACQGSPENDASRGQSGTAAAGAETSSTFTKSSASTTLQRGGSAKKYRVKRALPVTSARARTRAALKQQHGKATSAQEPSVGQLPSRERLAGQKQGRDARDDDEATFRHKLPRVWV